MAEFDAENVCVWEEQMKNSAAPIGGHSGGSCPCDCDDEDEEKDGKKRGYMNSDVNAWEATRAKIGTRTEVVEEEVEVDVDIDVENVPTGFMGLDVDMWEKKHAKIGTAPDVPKETEPENVPEPAPTGFMGSDVLQWEKMQQGDTSGI